MGCPPPPYIKEPKGGGSRPRRARQGGVLLPPGVGLPSFLVGIGEGGKRRKRGRKGGAPPPFPCPIRTRRGRGTRPSLGSFSLLPRGPCRPINPWGVPVTSRYSGKMPISPGTIPMSKHRLPIYQSLCLDHSETPRHVRDHIRDSEQTSVHQNL